MLRLFTGLSVPENIRDRLALVSGGIPGANWTRPENYHITLTFIGNVDETAAEDIDTALSRIDMAAFDVTVRGMGNFAQGDHPNVLWAGVEKTEPLLRLKEKNDRALETARVSFENRKYTPHVTLARFRRAEEGKLAEFIQEQNLLHLPPFRAESFILYESSLTKNGPAYDVLREYPLRD